MSTATEINGGLLAAEVLANQGVRFLYTLCGGHISPILIEAQRHGIRVIDTRHEATAVFAADATARLTGIVGVAAVTAGPGLTNTITALKNAQLAQSPIVVLGGATATLLKGRGALQDIDQMALMQPHVKWAQAVTRVKDIVPTLEKAFRIAQTGVPGPVFVELPVDMLYPESVVRRWSFEMIGKGESVTARMLKLYLEFHLRRGFHRAWQRRAGDAVLPPTPLASAEQLQQAVDALQQAQRPLLIIGSGAMFTPAKVEQLQQAVLALGVPTYLSGMARGLLGKDALHMRHKRSKALKEADVVILAGVPADFRLGYGRAIASKAKLIGVNRSKHDLLLNRKPDVAIEADPGAFLRMLASRWSDAGDRWRTWRDALQARDRQRDDEIEASAATETEYVNPVALCREIEAAIDDNSVIIGDGGDFVATASYVVRPRAPLRWLDPGAFGTLGAGAGFALASKLVYPDAEIWLIYGDGSAGYSLAEFDTFSRHGLAVIAVIGNDASWAQIAREQVEIFDSALGTELARSDYHIVARGFGGAGFEIDSPASVSDCLQHAKRLAAAGTPVCLNVQIGETAFRKGSISI